MSAVPRKGANIVFRVDASLWIGTGHVMRCLVLADLLSKAGASCHFVSRAHDGHLVAYIQSHGYRVAALAACDGEALWKMPENEHSVAHADWLGVHWSEDARETEAVLAAEYGAPVDWLVVDHYALDARWQRALQSRFHKLLVIDDIADRDHVCNILLDQNFVAQAETRYSGRCPPECQCLLGPGYALLRPDFEALRSESLTRRQSPTLNKLLVFLSGADITDETCKVVAGVKRASRRWQRIDVVVGQNYPARSALEADLRDLPGTVLHVQTPYMARLMSEADFAITAGGSVTWEKCALGLASAAVTLANNQVPIAAAMHEAGALYSLGDATSLGPDSYAALLDNLDLSALPEMSRRASAMCDGGGARKVARAMETHS